MLPARRPAACARVGTGFFPEDDRSEFIIAIETPPGSNIAYTRLKAQEAARIARAHPRCPTPTRRSAAARPARWTRATSTCSSCRSTSATLSAEEFAQVLRERDEARGRRDARRCSPTTSAAAASSCSSSSAATTSPRSTRRPSRCCRWCAARRARWTSACPPRGRSPSSTWSSNRGVAGTLGVTVGQVAQSLRPAFAGIDAGDWVDPDGRDARRAGAARAGGAPQRGRLATAAARRDGPQRRTDDAAARPGGDDQAGHRPGDHRPLDRDLVVTVRGQHIGPRDRRRDGRRTERGSTSITLPAGRALSARRRGAGAGRGVRRRSSRRSASRCC